MFILDRYYIDAPHIVLCAEPCEDMAMAEERAEVARVVDRVRKLGPEGLKRAAESLKAAEELEKEPTPDAVLDSFPVPDITSTQWISIQSVQEPRIARFATTGVVDDTTLAEHLAVDGNYLPFFVQYDHINHIKVGFFSTQ